LKGLDRPERIVVVTSDEPLPPAPRPQTTRKVRRNLFIGVVFAALLAGGLALLVGLSNGGQAPHIVTPAQSLAVIDASQRRVIADVPLPDHPESLAVGAGRVWVGMVGGSVAPVRFGASRADAPVGTCCDPAFLAYGAGAVWAFDPRTEHLTEIDRRQGVVASRRLWQCPASGPSKCGGGGVAVVGDEVWVGRASGSFYDTHGGSLYRVHADDLSKAGQIHDVAIGLLVANRSQVWTFGNHGIEADGLNIAPPHNIYHKQLPEEQEHTFSASFGGLAMRFGDAWIGAPRGNLYRLRTDGSLLQSNLGGGINAVATSSSAVWVALSNGTVLMVSPTTGRPIHRFHLGHTNPVALAATDNHVWVALA
jgi:hypothetical protein